MKPTRNIFPSLLRCSLAALCLMTVVETRALVYEVSGANLTADEGFGARQQGMGLQHAGFQTGADAVMNAPASMNDVDDFTLSTAHWERFDAATFDNLSVLVPWHENATVGFALARYAVGGIENRAEGDVNAVPGSVFTASDWLVSGSLARRFGGLLSGVDAGATVDLLYRRLDQNGLGLRVDGMTQYTFGGKYRAGIFIRGLVPSTVKWGSGYTEYEVPEASAFAAGRWNVPYFYGQLEAGWETPGLAAKGARSENQLEGNRAATDPFSLLKTSKLGAEFRFDFGLCIRAGFSEMNPAQAATSLRLGTGYGWRNMLGVDYAYSSHDGLSQTHRLALWWTPSFTRFEGRGFRPKSATRSERPTLERKRSGEKSPAAPGAEEAPDAATGSGPEKGKQKEVLEEEVLEEDADDP